MSVFPEIWAKLWKNALSAILKNPFKKFLDPDPEADDLQTLISSFSSTDSLHVKLS